MNSMQHANQKGFSLLEVVVSIAIFSFILLATISFIFWMQASSAKTKAQGQTQENAKRALDVIAYELRGAQSIYTPTTTQSQLSLETPRYAQGGQPSAFIDFFLCGQSLCLKKESQEPVAITSESVAVTALAFTNIANGTSSSVQISITVSNKNPANQPADASTVTLTSTVALRGY